MSGDQNGSESLSVVSINVERPIQEMTWTSFDRYARYHALASTLGATFGDDVAVVDVGDGAGYLQAFAGRPVVSVDVVPSKDPLPGAVLVMGSGTDLPFRDDQFDVAVSCDALEHVPAADRGRFLDEMVRVARQGIIVAAPFDTHGVAGAEQLVERYALLATGEPQEQLGEHRAFGLPDLEATQGALRQSGLSVESRGNGNLLDWIAVMLLKHQITARPALQPLADSLDSFYNVVLAHRCDVPPFYRQLIVATKRVRPAFPPTSAAPDGFHDDAVLPLLSAIAATTVTEVDRQDVQPGLIAAQTMLQDLLRAHTDLAASATIWQASAQRLEAQVDGMQREIAGLSNSNQQVLDGFTVLRADVERVIDALRHPFSALMGRLRRT